MDRHPEAGITLLVVDDEPGILCALRLMLKPDAFKVIEASTGDEALIKAAAHDGPIHLMLTDVDMPGMGGVETARAMRILRPEMPVLFMSGIRAVIRESRIPEIDNEHFIEKPFSAVELLAKIRNVFRGARAEEGRNIPDKNQPGSGSFPDSSSA